MRIKEIFNQIGLDIKLIYSLLKTDYYTKQEIIEKLEAEDNKVDLLDKKIDKLTTKVESLNNSGGSGGSTPYVPPTFNEEWTEMFRGRHDARNLKTILCTFPRGGDSWEELLIASSRTDAAQPYFNHIYSVLRDPKDPETHIYAINGGDIWIKVLPSGAVKLNSNNTGSGLILGIWCKFKKQ